VHGHETTWPCVRSVSCRDP